MNNLKITWIALFCLSLIRLSAQSIYSSSTSDGSLVFNIDGELDALNKGDAELYLQRCSNNARAGINLI